MKLFRKKHTGVKSPVIQEELGVESLLLHMEPVEVIQDVLGRPESMSQLAWEPLSTPEEIAWGPGQESDVGVSMLAIVIPVITNWGLSFVEPANTEQPGCAELLLSAQPQESRTNRPHHLDLFGSPSRSCFILPHGNILGQ